MGGQYNQLNPLDYRQGPATNDKVHSYFIRFIRHLQPV